MIKMMEIAHALTLTLTLELILKKKKKMWEERGSQNAAIRFLDHALIFPARAQR